MSNEITPFDQIRRTSPAGNEYWSSRDFAQVLDHLPPLIENAGVAAFSAQCLPTVESLLGLANYQAFLVKRRELIAQTLNVFLGTTLPSAM